MAASDRRVTLVRLPLSEHADFVDRQIREFADEKVRAGHWRREEALNLSRDAVTGVLPKGGPGAGHRVFKGLDGSGQRVGWVWLGPPPKEMGLRNVEWLYQITVEDILRGQGYGRALLRATEDLLSSEGVEALYLNVFDWNRVARSLYESTGYVVHYDGGTELGMHKRLRPRSPPPGTRAQPG